MTTATTIADLWVVFQTEVLSPGAGPVQRQEMRRAFYAGAWAMYCITTQQVPMLDEDEAMLALQALRKESIEFRQQVERGEA